jgi:hypothetical protein
MKISEAELHLYSKRNSKMYLIKAVNDIRGGGLVRSKEIVDSVTLDIDVGTSIMNILRKEPNWKSIKPNIRKLKNL